MTDAFYSAFEAHHRGPRELIRARVRTYTPLLKILQRMAPRPLALDLGCGRGEWLEVLQEEGITATGVDQDVLLVPEARRRGLNVVPADAVAWLASRPAASLLCISALHLVEHLPFEDLRRLVQEARRVLQPGGFLILETPNPENLAVASSSFYLDPTHQRPLPPGLLEFIPRYYGFARTHVLRLQEDAALTTAAPITLHQVLSGVSPDYAVVAQQNAAPEVMALADDFFRQQAGLSLDALATRFDHQTRQQKEALETMIIQQAEARARNAEQLAARLHSELDQVWQQAQALQEQARRSEARHEEQVRQSEVRQQQAFDQLTAVYASYSWRITRPLRSLAAPFWRRPGPQADPEALTRRSNLLLRLMAWVLARARLSHLAARFLRPLPGLRHYLTQVAIRGGLLPDDAVIAVPGREPAPSTLNPSQALLQASPGTRRLYRELQERLGRAPHKEQS